VDIGGIMTTLEEVEEWNAFYQIYEGATCLPSLSLRCSSKAV
jgi:hypothetical protein